MTGADKGSNNCGFHFHKGCPLKDLPNAGEIEGAIQSLRTSHGTVDAHAHGFPRVAGATARVGGLSFKVKELVGLVPMGVSLS